MSIDEGRKVMCLIVHIDASQQGAFLFFLSLSLVRYWWCHPLKCHLSLDYGEREREMTLLYVFCYASSKRKHLNLNRIFLYASLERNSDRSGNEIMICTWTNSEIRMDTADDDDDDDDKLVVNVNWVWMQCNVAKCSKRNEGCMHIRPRQCEKDKIPITVWW